MYRILIAALTLSAMALSSHPAVALNSQEISQLVYHVHQGNLAVLENLSLAEPSALSGPDAVCEMGCYRRRNLPPLPGGVDFCPIHNTDIGRCIGDPNCLWDCR